MVPNRIALVGLLSASIALPGRSASLDLECVFPRQPREADLVLNVSVNEGANTVSVFVPRSGSSELLKATITQTSIKGETEDSSSGQRVSINRVTGEIRRQLMMGPLGSSEWESGQCKKISPAKRIF